MSHPIRSREHLLHMLAEAAELEHNLLCSYLYAAFSLKRGREEDLLEHEQAAIERWRQAILAVCMEEMGHLAQIANLMVAVGSRPHFDRPNLPAAPGYHPACIQVALTPFDAATLDHFIYLERPEDAPVDDAPAFRSDCPPRRAGEVGVLMPSAPDYETIGEFYRLLAEGLRALAGEIGAESLFIGPADCQLRADEIGSPELAVVTDLATACRALDLIVVQGEGSTTGGETSHYERFLAVRREHDALVAARPAFRAARPVATHPVMRAPAAAARVHVTAREAARVLDAANAVYSLMLRCLVEVYETSHAHAGRRAALLGAAMGLMKILGELAGVLTTLPAADAAGSPNAGMTFTMLRSTEGYASGVDAKRLLVPRFADIERRLPGPSLDPAQAARLAETLAGLRKALAAI